MASSSSTNGQEEQQEWTDITHILIKGAHQLTKMKYLWRLISILSISSLPSKSIMDPRMDSGVGRGKEEEQETGKFDPLQPLTVPEIVTLIDLTLACEVTWYTGRLLSQSILTCQYLNHLDVLQNHHDPFIHLVLRSYLLGLIKSCALISDEILKENLRENEDVNMINNCLSTYTKNQCHSNLRFTGPILHVFERLSKWIPLMERIRVRIEFLYVLGVLNSTPTQRTIRGIERHIQSAREGLTILRSHSTFTNDLKIDFINQNLPVKLAFNLNFYQSVNSIAPPRPISFPDTFGLLVDSLDRILVELELVLDVALSDSFDDWLSFFHAFSRREPIGFPFIRSYLMTLFQNGNMIGLDPNHTLPWLANECISNLSAGHICFPPYNDNRVDSTNRYVLNRFAGFIVNYLSAFAANRARGRRILFNSLSEWKALYNTTWVNRLDLSSTTLINFQTLIYYFSIESSLQACLMGFDLDLYELDDDRIAMWWLIDRLTDRASLLLNLITNGSVESIDTKLIKILGKLARSAIQLTRRKHELSGKDPRDLKIKRAIFERRIKFNIAREANFDDTTLVHQLGLPHPLLDYHTFLESTQVGIPYNFESPVDLDSLDQVLLQLREILINAPQSKSIGLTQFESYVDCLIKATQNMITMNNLPVSACLSSVTEVEETISSLETLKISSSDRSSDEHSRIQLEENDLNLNDVDQDMIVGIRSCDVACRWFIV
ncbi:hypothetical protein H4Q26_004337 [Puccinia striiformis f. sp. tritici PST-130]|nr:hypothetical protein H4Q26_004337 [Puccinia striiformis f. sp. tritici PST-130]